MNKGEMLDKLLKGLGSEAETGIAFDYDDFNDGVAYLTAADGREFEVSVKEIG